MPRPSHATGASEDLLDHFERVRWVQLPRNSHDRPQEAPAVNQWLTIRGRSVNRLQSQTTCQTTPHFARNGHDGTVRGHANAIFASPAKHTTARNLLQLLKFRDRGSSIWILRVAEREGFEPSGVLTSQGVPPVDFESTALNQTRPPLRCSRSFPVFRLPSVQTCWARHVASPASSLPASRGCSRAFACRPSRRASWQVVAKGLRKS